ncbi:BON domain-containing protein [Chamaesiphon sp.]|uniref:BON domain-containing protein n=1 Tax=Chamaesiphon sp. TaxID=2814140 RepID=UPI0035934CE3
MINTLDKTDTELQDDVLSELSYEPSVNVTDIGALVENGTVTLNGCATSYVEKWAAVNAVKRVNGVQAIIDEIEVNIPDAYYRTDEDITQAVIDRIAWSTIIPSDVVEVIVNDGWVSLAGEVEWWYQQNAAVDLVQQIMGVTGVSNGISVQSKAVKMAIEEDINSALKRSAIVDVDRIQVESENNKVVLRGDVRSFAARDEAERIAWSEPGVWSVDNHLGVNWSSIVE